MLIHPILEKLRELKLEGMLKAFEEQLASSSYNDWSFEDRFGLMLDREMTYRQNRRLNTRLRHAKLRLAACMEDIDYQHRRGLDKALMQSLFTSQWVREHLNVLVTGPTGVGKSYIACALAHRACLEGFKVLYLHAPRLFRDLGLAKGDGRYSKLMNSIAKTDLILIDDWGLAPLSTSEQRDFFEIIEDRHGLRSSIITSQFSVSKWHDLMENPTLADAILDRIVNCAHRIEMKGDSMRKQKPKLT